MNDFIKRVKKLETRKQGAESQTRQRMQEIEFYQLHEVFKLSSGTTNSYITWIYGMPALVINFQFHMKVKRRVSDQNDDVELPYRDCKVAEKLCIGGPPCYYLINNSICNPCILTTFILIKVTPNVCQRLPDSTCIVVLGKAFL
jgi:hypothetical protein